MQKEIIVTVTGAAGQVAGYLLPYIASGELFKNNTITLKLLDTSNKLEYLKSIQMELEDCCYPPLKRIIVTDDSRLAFKDCNRAILIGAKPRTAGMSRSDLICDNAKIFAQQGKIINKVSDENIKVIVVGNPVNTNCYVTMKNAPDISKKNFSALTFLDVNRTYSSVASFTEANISDINNIILWGNHGETIYPDLEHASINGINALSYINDNEWIYNKLPSYIRNRGSQVIKFKKVSSGMSAAKAIVDHISYFENGIPNEKWFCAGVPSDGSYGVDEDIVFSLPIINDGGWNYSIVKNLATSIRTKDEIHNSIQAIKNEIKLAELSLKS